MKKKTLHQQKNLAKENKKNKQLKEKMILLKNVVLNFFEKA